MNTINGLPGKVRGLHERQPMMLDDAGIKAWLAGGDPMLSAEVAAQIHHWPVTPQMNKPDFDAPDCIEALVNAA